MSKHAGAWMFPHNDNPERIVLVDRYVDEDGDGHVNRGWTWAIVDQASLVRAATPTESEWRDGLTGENKLLGWLHESPLTSSILWHDYQDTREQAIADALEHSPERD